MKPQKLATKSAAPAFPLRFRIGELGFDSDTLMKILSGTGVATFFPKSTTTGAIIKSGCSRPNAPSPVVSDRNNKTYCERAKPVEEMVYCSKCATLLRISPKGKWKEQGLLDIEIWSDPSTGNKR